MANFYAIYPPNADSPNTIQTVQGEGTPGAQTGGILTIQGDPGGTAIPISGSITATNPSVAPTAAAVPADATYIGMNVSGNLVGLAGTASGLNTVVNAALPAGAAIIGKVGIDQTTPGTTNGVQVNAALPAGTNIIGNIRIDQTTPGTTNGVQVNAALPAGANVIGAVTQSGGPWTVTGSGTAGSSATGVVTIQGIASGTVVPVSVSSTAPVTTTTATWQAEGVIAAGSITSSYQTVFTPSASTKILFMRNNTNASITVSMDAGTTINFVLDAGDQIAVDFLANALISTTTAIQIKSSGSPTTGSFRVNGCH